MRSPCFVLVHSPLVGPTVWKWTGQELTKRGADVVIPALGDVTTFATPRWRGCVDAVVDAVPNRDDVVLVAHSGAGPLLPAIGGALKVPPARYVFVDARMPAPPGASTALEADFRDFLASLAQEGVVPKWSEWWGPGAMEALVPDLDRRQLVERELPMLPLAFFDEPVPTPEAWVGRVDYLQLSSAYEVEAREAASRGWTVDLLAGGHLHMAVDPEAVADRLLGLATTR
ncbi:MAG: alpha/beta fold hydrolase [Acidimicrobiia bacterium]